MQIVLGSLTVISHSISTKWTILRRVTFQMFNRLILRLKKLTGNEIILAMLSTTICLMGFMGWTMSQSQKTISTNRDASPWTLPVSGNRFKKQIDIVISFCKEPIDVLGNLTAKLRHIPSFDSRYYTTRILVYHKCGLDMDALEFQKLVGADLLIELPNKGRESGTYLEHIVRNYRYLSQFTLFIQAAPHFMDNLVYMLKEHFSSDLGMLPLGEMVVCDCGHLCKQNGIFGHVRDVYALFMGSFCTKPYAVSLIDKELTR